MNTNCGIYMIMNLVNGKFYIGSSYNINNRWNNHKACLRTNNHPSKYLQRAYNKYGEENFIFEILENCLEEKLLEREQIWLDFHHVYNKDIGYNNLKNAKSCIGRIPSEIHKKRISEALTNRYKNMTFEEYKSFAKEKSEKLKGKRKLSSQEIANFCQRMKSAKKWYNDEETFKYIIEKATEAKKKPILQYSLEGEYLNEFPSAIEAILHIGKPRKCSNVLNGVTSGKRGRKTAYGYIWKYKNNINN